MILTWLFGDNGLDYFIFCHLTANRKFHENQQNAGHQVNEIRVPRLWFVNKEISIKKLKYDLSTICTWKLLFHRIGSYLIESSFIIYIMKQNVHKQIV